METFSTVILLVAMIAVGVLVIQLFTRRHDDRTATLPSGHTRLWRLRPWHRTEK
ncbi:hypothetical protein [Streptomyces sp. 142MFCol3.1]|uniref:hypothetical protein n=1 Tax=Streptomyces sp. 142MFCol3.1 TaxID=1172179 RepID=UPI00041FF6F8|nr:hypothetical protein [Streptomyces sp. 142MFCol3.1]